MAHYTVQLRMIPGYQTLSPARVTANRSVSVARVLRSPQCWATRIVGGGPPRQDLNPVSDSATPCRLRPAPCHVSFQWKNAMPAHPAGSGHRRDGSAGERRARIRDNGVRPRQDGLDRAGQMHHPGRWPAPRAGKPVVVKERARRKELVDRREAMTSRRQGARSSRQGLRRAADGDGLSPIIRPTGFRVPKDRNGEDQHPRH